MVVLVDLVGLTAKERARIAQACPGRRIYIPLNFYADHWLLEHLSPEGLRYLVWEWGGCFIEIPLGEACRSWADIDRQERNALIRTKRAEGWTISRLIAEFCLSRAQMFRICSNDSTLQSI